VALHFAIVDQIGERAASNVRSPWMSVNSRSAANRWITVRRRYGTVPDSFNRLGDAYAGAGKKAEAVRSYEEGDSVGGSDGRRDSKEDPTGAIRADPGAA
jgi:hypothetical protein